MENVYISLEDILNYKEETRDHFAPLHREVINAFVYGLCQLPQAKVKPIRKGKWVLNHGIIDYYTCNCCGSMISQSQLNRFFCPRCGAEMEVETDDE